MLYIIDFEDCYTGPHVNIEVVTLSLLYADVPALFVFQVLANSKVSPVLAYMVPPSLERTFSLLGSSVVPSSLMTALRAWRRFMRPSMRVCVTVSEFGRHMSCA